ncbi:MAG: ImmA/IrrE family metallo-endopeptidase [Clostridia bacterium]|nr:ImmA/IrrE family metallo-endopeptidase [Clostridia bacterium]
MNYSYIDTEPACVPYLSSAYIDSRCGELVRKFDPKAALGLRPLNIEQFITGFLGLRLEFEHLSSDHSVLGAAVFADGELPVYDRERGSAVYRRVREDSVFIDPFLTRAGKNNLYRFTLAHEAGHALWHGMYQRARLRAGKTIKPYLSCERQNVTSAGADTDRLSDRRSLLEYQANRSAAALLMPESAINKLVSSFGEYRTTDEIADLVIFIAGACRVSDKAAACRLKQLGLISESGEREKILA